MLAFFSILLAVLAGLAALPVAIFLFEVLAAVLLPKRLPAIAGLTRARVAVIVPAHNEGSGLVPTLSDIKAQLNAGDRLIVVADNCTDDTAAVARAANAEVAERSDPTRRGKGYALDFGLRFVEADPPAIVVIVDADCRVASGSIDRLAAACAETGGPAQALDLMQAPEGAAINQRVAEFAWRVKNWMRPLGLDALGLPCQLMGTGMAFPWSVIRSAELATGRIVEDLRLGLDLAAAGHPARFCPDALVTSRFPLSTAGAESQRQRWEHGHVSTILSAALPLAASALMRRNLGLLALTLDMAVPPLSLLALLALAMFLLTGAWALLGLSCLPLAISACALAGFTLAAGLCWLKMGRDLLPPASLLSIFFYIAGKFGFYRRMMSGRIGDGQWVRTDRNNSDSEPPAR